MDEHTDKGDCQGPLQVNQWSKVSPQKHKVRAEFQDQPFNISMKGECVNNHMIVDIQDSFRYVLMQNKGGFCLKKDIFQ